MNSRFLLVSEAQCVNWGAGGGRNILERHQGCKKEQPESGLSSLHCVPVRMSQKMTRVVRDDSRAGDKSSWRDLSLPETSASTLALESDPCLLHDNAQSPTTDIHSFLTGPSNVAGEDL